MNVRRHPAFAADIREVAEHYREISDKVLAAFWKSLDAALDSIEKNPKLHHYDSSGLRRANLRRFPYHILYEVEEDEIFLLVLRYDRRDPGFGLERS